MPNTPAQVDAYARAHPTRDGGSWAGWCASFCYRAGGFENAFPNAMAAGDASGPLNQNWSSAGVGAIHYWAGVGGDGHCAFDLGGNTLLMASNAVSNYGTAVGTISFSEYARKGIPYRGWSYRWGAETLNLTGLAGLGTKPFIEDEGDDMPKCVYMRSAAGGDWYGLIDSTGLHKITPQQSTDLRGFGGVTNISEATWKALEAWTATLPTAATPTIDYSKIGSAVVDAFKSLPDLILTRFRTFWSTGK